MIDSIKIFGLIFLFINLSLNIATSNTCEEKNLEIKTTSIPDEFQAKVILNSFLKDQIIDDLTSWFTESHFPYGKSTVWHKINLETSTVDLSKYDINETLVMVYYQSQTFCGIGGQCSTYLLREVGDEWQKIDQWHDVKWERVYMSSCEKKIINILLSEGNDYVEPELNEGRLIKINFN